MPIPGVQPTEIKGFLGANIRIDQVDLSAEGGVVELGRATNTDKHTTPQTIRLRKGFEEQFSSALADTTIRRLGKVNSIRYEVAGTNLYRDQTSIKDYRSLALDSTRLHSTIVAFKPLNDRTIWAFIADRGTLQKDDGTNTRRWGLPAPATFEVAQLNSATYTYIIGVSQIRFDGTTVAHESNTTEITITETV